VILHGATPDELAPVVTAYRESQTGRWGIGRAES
jgi:hypothetical protein